MPADTLPLAGAQALAELESRPAAMRALIALCLQGVMALPLTAIVAPGAAAAFAGTAATFFLFGRQIEQVAPYWRQGLRLRVTWAAGRQAGYPAIATAAAALFAAMLSGGA